MAADTTLRGGLTQFCLEAVRTYTFVLDSRQSKSIGCDVQAITHSCSTTLVTYLLLLDCLVSAFKQQNSIANDSS